MQRTALFFQLDRDVMSNNTGYKIYEGIMGLFGIIPHLSFKLSLMHPNRWDNFELKWIIPPKILNPSKR
jgi:hypothetical protein